MRKSIRVVTATALISLPLTVSAESNRDLAEQFAFTTQLAQAQMETCATAFGDPFSASAAGIESKMRNLIDSAGFDVDRYWTTHRKKIDALKVVDGAGLRIATQQGDRKKLEAVREGCTVSLQSALSDEKSLDEAISQLNRKAGRVLTNNNTRTAASGTCAYSADFYQDRFKKTGKMSDLTCFQKAGRRELDSVQN